MTGNKTRIGLMFGSFDPPHLGHVETARISRDANSLREIWMAPVPLSPFKRKNTRKRASFDQKLAMCDIIATPYSDWLKVSPLCRDFNADYLRQLQSVKRTLEKLAEEQPDKEFVIVAGSDFRQKLLFSAQMLRIASTLTGKTTGMAGLNLAILQEISARLDRAAFTLGNIEVPEQARSDLTSSTKIVAQILAGENPVPGVPDDLLAHILKENIYTPEP